MAAYKCIKCGREVDLNLKSDKIMCNHCSERILLKKRPEIGKRVDAI